MVCSIFLTVSATALQIVSDHRQLVTRKLICLFTMKKRALIKLRMSLSIFVISSAGFWRFEKPRLFEV